METTSFHALVQIIKNDKRSNDSSAQRREQSKSEKVAHLQQSSCFSKRLLLASRRVQDFYSLN